MDVHVHTHNGVLCQSSLESRKEIRRLLLCCVNKLRLIDRNIAIYRHSCFTRAKCRLLYVWHKVDDDVKQGWKKARFCGENFLGFYFLGF